MTNQHNSAEHHEHSATQSGQNTNIMAVFAYLWILVVIPFLTDAKNDPFVKFHIKQGLALLVFEAVGWVANWFLIWIPVFGWLIMMVWWLVSLILIIVGILNVVNNKEKELPLIGQYARNFNF